MSTVSRFPMLTMVFCVGIGLTKYGISIALSASAAVFALFVAADEICFLIRRK